MWGTLGVLDNLPQIPSLGLPYVISYMYSNVSSWSLQNVLYFQYKVAVQTALPLRRSQIMSVPSRPSHMDGWALFWCSVCSCLCKLPTILLLIQLIKNVSKEHHCWPTADYSIKHQLLFISCQWKFASPIISLPIYMNLLSLLSAVWSLHDQ